MLNNTNLAGRPAAEKVFSDHSRFALYPIHTRFDDLQWFIADAQVECPLGYAEVVFQGDEAAAKARFAELSLLDQRDK